MDSIASIESKRDYRIIRKNGAIGDRNLVEDGGTSEGESQASEKNNEIDSHQNELNLDKKSDENDGYEENKLAIQVTKLIQENSIWRVVQNFIL